MSRRKKEEDQVNLADLFAANQQSNDWNIQEASNLYHSSMPMLANPPLISNPPLNQEMLMAQQQNQMKEQYMNMKRPKAIFDPNYIDDSQRMQERPNKRIKQEIPILPNQPFPTPGMPVMNNLGTRTPQQFNMQQRMHQMNQMQCNMLLNSFHVKSSHDDSKSSSSDDGYSNSHSSYSTETVFGSIILLILNTRPANAPTPRSSVNTPQQSEVELDLEGMMDVTNYAGVDLKEEEFSLNELANVAGAVSQERYKEVPFLNINQLEKKVSEIAEDHSVENVDESFLLFLSKAADNYIMNLLTEMCKAADHRSTVDYNLFCKNTGPLDGEYELEVFEEDDAKLKLLEIETKEREEQDRLFETVGPRPTEEDMEAEAQSSSIAVSGSTTTGVSQSVQKSSQSVDSKKQKRPATKKELPEAIKNKMTNNAALMAAGSSIKSWMLPGATIAAPTPKIVAKETKLSPSGLQPGATIRPGSRLRPQKRITLKDALFVMESQRELKCSELFYKWWANVK